MDFDDLDIAAQNSLQDLKKEIQLADPATLRLLMTQARTFNAWQDKSVSIETLNQIYQIMKMGPTSGICCPPQNPAVQLGFKDNPEGAETAAFRNGSLQGAYFIIAARAVGLDCGPMSGFDNASVDEEFFAETTFHSNFLCNIGYGDVSKTFKRLPRLDFDVACQVL